MKCPKCKSEKVNERWWQYRQMVIATCQMCQHQWLTLPDAVKRAFRADVAALNRYKEQVAAMVAADPTRKASDEECRTAAKVGLALGKARKARLEAEGKEKP